MTELTRRDFIKSSLVVGAAIGMTPSLLRAAGKEIPIGVQLFSVRNDCAKDFDAALAQIAKMGFTGVEFAGYHGRDAKALRKLLDDTGLKCCGTHIGLETLLDDKLPKTIEFNHTLGNPFLIVPGLPEKYRKTRQDWQNTADLFSELADKVKPHGMREGRRVIELGGLY